MSLVFPRNLDGSRRQLGAEIRTLSENFINASAVPSWLQVAAGTASYSNTTGADGGGITVTSGASIGNAANLRTLDGATTRFRPSAFQEMRFRLGRFRMPTPGDLNFTLSIGMELTGSNLGVRFVRKADGTTWFQHSNSTTDEEELILPGWETSAYLQRPRDIELCWHPTREALYLLYGDQVMAARDLAGLGITTTSAVHARIDLVTHSAQAKSFMISSFRLGLVHD